MHGEARTTLFAGQPQRALHPYDVPVAVEFAAAFAEHARFGESEPSMELGRRVVGKRDSSHDAMDVLVPERVEQHLVKYSSDSPPGHFARAIDRGRDAGVVG